MKPPKRVAQLSVAAVISAALGFAFVFLTLRATVEPVLGWSLAVLLYASAIALTVILVRLVIRTAPTRSTGRGSNPG